MINMETCTHEASHTLSLFLLGGKIKRVEINGAYQASESIGSHPGLFRDSISITHPLTKNVICILLAGPAAEFKYTGNKNIKAASEDIHLARACLKIKGWKDDESSDTLFFQRWSQDARKFVEHPIRWKMIFELAKKFRQVREMTGREVVAFIQKEAEKMTAIEQLEFYFSDDLLSGYQLPISEHGG